MIKFTVIGEPVSLKNNKEIIYKNNRRTGRKHPSVANNDLVVSYQKFFLPQIPWNAQQMIDVDVRVFIKIWYRTERPDLDPAIILDLMQAQYKKNPITGKREIVRRGVYTNDRLAREHHFYHGIDKKNPRAEIIVEKIQDQGSLFDMYDHAINQNNRGLL